MDVVTFSAHPPRRRTIVPPPPEQIPPIEMLREMGEQVSATHRMIGQHVGVQARIEESLATFQKFVAARFLDLNDAIKRVDKRTAALDGDVNDLRGRLDRLHEKVHAEFPEHAQRLTELERTRYQRPGSHVSMNEAVQRVNNSIVPGSTTKQDLGTQMDGTGSFKVQGDVLDKMLAERDAAKIVAESLEAKLVGKRRREAVVTAVAIAATLGFLSLFLWMLMNAAAMREHSREQGPATTTAPAR
jgi:hypothetical protein